MTDLIWLSGLPGSGKSTLGSKIVSQLRMESRSVVMLDGDDVRNALLNDLSYSQAERMLQFKRLVGLACLLNKQVEFVVVCSVSFLEQTFHSSSLLFDRTVVIRIDATRETLRFRNQKGLYSSAQKGGAQPDLPGVNQAWMKPENPDFVFFVKPGGDLDFSIRDLEQIIYPRGKTQ